MFWSDIAGKRLAQRNTASRLDWGTIFKVGHCSPLDDILRRHEEVFREELGTYTGDHVKTLVDPTEHPRYCKARPVPYAMRDKVEAEHQRLQEQGVIEPVTHADWAAPVVAVLKKDRETVRLCGDYKQTVNRAVKLDRYPIPRIEDIFTKMTGCTVFSTLNMSQAYQQLILDEESRRLITVNTHKGLFQYKRLLFGVASATGIFQRTMENVLQDILQVGAYLDDILIGGRTETDHLVILEKVLVRL